MNGKKNGNILLIRFFFFFIFESDGNITLIVTHVLLHTNYVYWKGIGAIKKIINNRRSTSSWLNERNGFRFGSKCHSLNCFKLLNIIHTMCVRHGIFALKKHKIGLQKTENQNAIYYCTYCSISIVIMCVCVCVQCTLHTPHDMFYWDLKLLTVVVVMPMCQQSSCWQNGFTLRYQQT